MDHPREREKAGELVTDVSRALDGGHEEVGVFQVQKGAKSAGFEVGVGEVGAGKVVNYL